MKHVVKLEDIIEGLEFQSSEMSAFLDQRTGEVIGITDEEMRAAEAEVLMDKFPAWQQESIKIAQEILEEEHFIPLPSSFDMDEYRIMEAYCWEIEDDHIREKMTNAIAGRGAFRRFKDMIRKYDIEDGWYRYRSEAIKRVAIEWCEREGIPYKED